MRIPFPVKVFFALLAVVAAGALPTYFYIENSFVDQLTTARVEETSRRASLLVIGPVILRRNVVGLRRRVVAVSRIGPRALGRTPGAGCTEPDDA